MDVHRELSALYDAALVGKAAPLPPIDVHYADFAEMLGRS
jgi:hypothetical protein